MDDDKITFTVQCTMKRRWVPHFLGMLKKMQWLGSVGSSRDVTFMSDGDGDFRPKFSWDEVLPKAIVAEGKGPEQLYFDAG